MERYLITGASGFIGQALCKKLTKLGHQVLPLPRKWDSLPEFDCLIHLAAYGNKYNQEDEQEMFDSNILLLWKLLQETKNMKYKAFINTATSSIYGEKHKPMVESDSLDSDRFYGVTKACGSLLVRAFAKKYDKPAVTVVPFSVYGPNDDPKHFIPVAVNAFKNNKEFKLAPGMHDWIYIEDYIQGVFKLIEKAELLKGMMVNIGTGKQFSNLEVIAILRQLFSKPGKIKKVEQMRDYDTQMWVADNSLLKELGWRQQFSLEEGLERCVYGNKE